MRTPADRSWWDLAIGPFYTAQAAGLALKHTDVQELIISGDLLGVATSDDRLLLPSRQFDDGVVAPVPGLPPVVSMLRTVFGPWRIALWVLAPSSVWGGRNAAEVLHGGWAYPVEVQAWRTVMTLTDGEPRLPEPRPPIGWGWERYRDWLEEAP